MTRPSGSPHDRAVRVLHLTNDFGANGTGITNLLYTLARAQVEMGMTVHVGAFSIDDAHARGLQEIGVVFHRMPRLTGPGAVWRTRTQLHRLVAEHLLEVVHAHTVKATLAALTAGRHIRRHSVATIHNSFQRSARLMLLTRRPVSVSEAVRAEMARLGPFPVPVRTTVIPNGVGAHHGSGAPPPEVTQRTALYVGGLHHRKGVDVVLRAFAQVAADLPDTNLVIAGRRDAPAVEDLAGTLGLSAQVTFLGLLADPRPAMEHAGVVLVPSRHEPFGLVAAEARLAGAPVLASDTGGLREVLDGGAAGRLLPVGDVDAWAQAIASMLGDADHRDEWARRSSCGSERFDDRAMAAGYEQLYRGLLGRTVRPLTAAAP